MRKMNCFLNVAWLSLVTVLALRTSLVGSTERYETEALDAVLDVSATTINPEDGKLVTLDTPTSKNCSLDKLAFFGVSELVKSVLWISLIDPSEKVIDPDTLKVVNKTYTWVEARNKCRSQCMDLVALATYEKALHLEEVLEKLGVDTGVWIAGKRCLADECEFVDEPVHLNGWYWSTTGEKIYSAHKSELWWRHNPWSNFGAFRTPQPDNAANLEDRSVIEACLAIKPDPGTNKMGWHDEACGKKLAAVCEPAPSLRGFLQKIPVYLHDDL